MRKLTMEELNKIEFFGSAKIGEDEYTFKFYEGKSEIRMNGELVATIDNSKPVTDESRVEYVEQGWIPCSKRLPENTDEWKAYITCNEKGIISTTFWADGWNCWRNPDGEINRACEITDIVAWMPLPEPYKEG